MDRFKVKFRCHTEPEEGSGLRGFKEGEAYEGRSFNGLVEVSPRWGRSADSKLIGLSVFKRYFEWAEEKQTMNEQLVKQPA